MTQTLWISLAIAVGVGQAMQASMIGAMARARGPTEAAWISLLATLCGLAIAFGLRSIKGDPPSLPSPFDGALIFGPITILAGMALAISVRGLPVYLAFTGACGFAYLVAAGLLAPRLGIALFASAVTAGTLAGAIGLDHFGAFGGAIHRFSIMRGVGLIALVVGVVLIRTSR